MKWPVVTPVMNIVIGFPNGLTFVPRYTEVYSFHGDKECRSKIERFIIVILEERDFAFLLLIPGTVAE